MYNFLEYDGITNIAIIVNILWSPVVMAEMQFHSKLQFSMAYLT